MNETSQQYSQTPQDLQKNLHLRPPLCIAVDDNHDGEIRSLICRMFLASEILRIGMETRFTALVLLHRFHAATIRTANTNNPTNRNKGKEENDSDNSKTWETASCLFLACKAEEEPRRLRDIFNVAHMVIFQESSSQETSDNNEDVKNTSQEVKCPNDTTLVLQVKSKPPPLDADYSAAKEKIVRAEQVVLRWLGFDVSVSKPHRAVAVLVKEEPLSEILSKQDPSMEQRIVSIAWRRLNDSVFYARALNYSAIDLAFAAIALAMDELGDSLCSTQAKHWWNPFGLSDETFSRAKEALESATENLKRHVPRYQEINK